MKKLLFFLFPFFALAQTPTVVVQTKFDWATNTTNAVVQFKLTDEYCPSGGLTINYTISDDTYIDRSSGSISFLEGEFKKDLVISKNATISGTQSVTLTLTSGTGYIVEPNGTFMTGGIANFNVAESLPVPAFPGAEGAGAFVTGGRGGTVLHVTSLADDGSTGTLRWALTQNYPRIIVFDVSGIIDTNAMWDIAIPPNVTIAGQTAPEGGITIRHRYGIYLKRSSNIIMRYLRFEFDQFRDGTTTTRTALYVDGNDGLIIDHCEFRFAGNTTALSVWDDNYRQGNVTVQRSHLSNSQTGSLAGGAASSTTRRNYAGTNTFHHNLFTHVSHRFPNMDGNGFFEVINNVNYNPYFRGATVYNTSEVNYVGNYSRKYSGSSYPAMHALNIGEYLFSYQFPENDFRIYTNNNRWEASGATYDKDYTSWTGVVFRHPESSGLATRQASESPWRTMTRFDPLGIPVTEQDPLVAFNSIVADVGANKYLNADGTYGVYLDTVATRYIDDAVNATCATCSGATRPDVTNRSILYYNLPTNTRPAGYDTDNDGMPDTWETANGLNNSIDDSVGNDLDPNYTNIEMFINSVDSAVASYGYTVTPTSGLTTTEAGGSDTFTVVLNELPASNVVFDITSNDTGEGTVSASTLTFTTGNWSTPQTITVTGVDDGLADGNVAYTVTVSVNDASSDDNYDPLADTTVNLNNTDNDTGNGKVINARGGRVRINGKFMRIKTN